MKQIKRNRVNNKLNQLVKPLFFAIGLSGLLMVGSSAYAQDLEQIRWKSESQVRTLLGDPNSIQGPVGTHASYTLWKYDQFTVAFANNRAFHLFDKDSLKKIVLDENRSENY